MTQLRAQRADLVIVDLNMKPLDGLGFTRLIRADRHSPDPYLPILMMTGHAELTWVREARDAGVTGLGYVEDPGSEIATWSAFIVPLRLGAGTRVKIAESFARGCATVSTSLGAFGYPVQHDKEILIANTAADFVEGCRSLLTDPARRDRIGRAGRDFFLANLSWDAIEPAVRATVESCRRQEALP